jgi:ABC-type nickel/cobalt efflux system permease component RcnA
MKSRLGRLSKSMSCCHICYRYSLYVWLLVSVLCIGAGIYLLLAADKSVVRVDETLCYLILAAGGLLLCICLFMMYRHYTDRPRQLQDDEDAESDSSYHDERP